MVIVKKNKMCVTPPVLPRADRSGAVGQRLLKLLSIQAGKSLRWIRQECRRTGIAETGFRIPDGRGMEWPMHVLYEAATNAGMFAFLARFGEPGKTMGGVSREEMEEMARVMIRAVSESHPLGERPAADADWWHKGHALRLDYLFGMGAWLLWDDLYPAMQLLVARILEHDADLYNNDQPPALLYDDTQGESNAWTASGLALAHCMLKRHPRRDIWGEKAKEFMVSAYATAKDVASKRLVDGKPLNRWLRAPNAFPDYTVENHGFIHPIYIAAISEMVRTAACYRLAGEPVPQAATFNADHVLDILMFLNLPDGNHFYVQGTDYDPRRIDSFFQACNIIPLKPNPLREACFRRALGSMERMARERPDMHMSGDIAFDFDFGSSWGLMENYLARRLFGSPRRALPGKQIEARLAGVHVNEPGKFAIHRTPRTLSSFSWHAIERGSQVMGMTLALDEDVMCVPVYGSYIGEITEVCAGPAIPLKVLAHELQKKRGGFCARTELLRCGGKVRQECVFASLPNGWSVYVERRTAVEPVAIASAESGTVWIYDDTRWPFQESPRTFHCEDGLLRPVSGRVHKGNWLNVDDRMGYVAIGADWCRLTKSTERYRAWRLAFLHAGPKAKPARFDKGETIGCFALVSCPNQAGNETRDLARAMSGGWLVNDEGVLALTTGPYVVYSNFSERSVDCVLNGKHAQLESLTSGWYQHRDPSLRSG